MSTDQDVLLTRREVERRTGLSRSPLYRKMRDGTFLVPLKVSERAVRWCEKVNGISGGLTTLNQQENGLLLKDRSRKSSKSQTNSKPKHKTSTWNLVNHGVIP